VNSAISFQVSLGAKIKLPKPVDFLSSIPKCQRLHRWGSGTLFKSAREKHRSKPRWRGKATCWAGVC